MTIQEVTKRLPAKKNTESPDNARCAVIATLRLFATKWKPCILCYLSASPLRYNQLYRAIPNISRKMLSQHLDELEADHLIIRTIYDRKLQHVEYRLSPKGNSLLTLMHSLEEWGLTNIPDVLPIAEMVDRARLPNNSYI
jgi:DNA-binding HxlR family transcriptional regulator